MKVAVLCLCFLFGVLSASAYPYNNYYGRPSRATYHHRPARGNPYRRSICPPGEAAIPGATSDGHGPHQYPEEQFQQQDPNVYPQQDPNAFLPEDPSAYQPQDPNVYQPQDPSAYQPQEPNPLGFPVDESGVNNVLPDAHTETAFIPADIPTEAESAVGYDVSTGAPPKRNPKRKQKPQKPVGAESDDGDDGHHGGIPFAAGPGRKGGNSNVFFPIVFGSHGGSRRNADGYGPGPATAIANSFSTGRGGIARSHATAYGNPNPELYLRKANGLRNHPQ